MPQTSALAPDLPSSPPDPRLWFCVFAAPAESLHIPYPRAVRVKPGPFGCPNRCCLSLFVDSAVLGPPQACGLELEVSQWPSLFPRATFPYPCCSLLGFDDFRIQNLHAASLIAEVPLLELTAIRAVAVAFLAFPRLFLLWFWG